MILNLHVRDETLRLREIKGYAQGHTTCECQRQDWNPDLWMTSLISCFNAPCSDCVQTWAVSFMTGNDHFRKQMLGIKAMIFFFFMRVDQLSTQIRDCSLVHRVSEMAQFLAVPLVLGLHYDILYFGALWLGGHHLDKSMDPLTVENS